jgi:hypothetical protein
MINHPEFALAGNTNAILPEVPWSSVYLSGVGCRDFFQDICLNNNTKLSQVQFVYFFLLRSRQFAGAVN